MQSCFPRRSKLSYMFFVLNLVRNQVISDRLDCCD
uniref:Uncharacterized protein n=1 Tax=Arundo donax TaxID=35708 RepID=A0A0A9B822_ARUDO